MLADTIPLEKLYLPPEKRKELEQRKRAVQDRDIVKKDLSDITSDKSNPLATLKGVVLKNANSAKRDPNPQGSTVERGVKQVESTFPDELKPSNVMKRFKLFKWAPDHKPDTAGLEDTSGLHLGTVGVSAKNKMGDTGTMRYVANRGGTGMVSGQLKVTYKDVYLATSEAMKWGTLGRVDYEDDKVAMVVKLQPQCFEGFAVALEDMCQDAFTFESQLNPPLFVADMSTKRVKKKPHTSGSDNYGMAAAAQEASEEATGIRTGTQPWTKKDAPDPTEVKTNAKPASVSRMAAEITDEQVFREEMREQKQVLQREVNERFQELATVGKSSKLLGLLKRGWQVHVDRAPLYQRRDLDYQRKRAFHMEKQREEEEQKKRIINMWLEEGQEPVRVKPEIDARDASGNTALMLAARNGWHEVVDELINVGANNRKVNNQGQNALAKAKAESQAATMAIFANAPGAAERKRRAAKCVQLLDERSILTTVKQGDLRRARFLLAEQGHNVNATNKYGMTPMHFAVMNQDVEMVELLVSFGGDQYAKNNNNQSAVSLIAGIKDESIATALQKALQAGPAAAKLREKAIIELAAQEKAKAKERDLLAREMRIYTKGTAAAAAVFTSFKKRHGSKQGAYKTDITQALTAYPVPDPKLVKAPRGQYEFTESGAAATDWKPDKPRNGLDLTTAWNRHALSLFHKQMKDKAARDYTAKVKLQKAKMELEATQRTLAGGTAARKALRKTEVDYWSQAGEEQRTRALLRGKTFRSTGLLSKTAPAVHAQGSASSAQAEYQKRSANPRRLDEELRHDTFVPSEQDPAFDAWMRLRFGTTAIP